MGYSSKQKHEVSNKQVGAINREKVAEMITSVTVKLLASPMPLHSSRAMKCSLYPCKHNGSKTRNESESIKTALSIVPRYYKALYLTNQKLISQIQGLSNSFFFFLFSLTWFRSTYCCIKDTGTGIDAEILPRLFTKFATKSDRGTGLGLFISKSIVEAHGGKIWAENNSDVKGATFAFSLPLIVQQDHHPQESRDISTTMIIDTEERVKKNYR